MLEALLVGEAPRDTNLQERKKGRVLEVEVCDLVCRPVGFELLRICRRIAAAGSDRIFMKGIPD